MRKIDRSIVYIVRMYSDVESIGWYCIIRTYSDIAGILQVIFIQGNRIALHAISLEVVLARLASTLIGT